MKVTLLSYTNNPEEIIEVAAKTCYSPGTVAEKWEEESDTEKLREFVDKLRKMGHDSPFEHANFTFGIDGISRACSHQLVRHRIASFSQQSQRYVKYDTENTDIADLFVVPTPILNGNNDIFDVYADALEQVKDVYEALAGLLEDSGISEKEAAENARYILPNAMKTNLVMTMNARELLHFFELRCCNRAQEEIRELAWTMLRMLQDKFPVIFEKSGPKCLIDKCSEGSMGCGKPYQKELF